jgi:molybdenum cofactor guanylyltransferase
MASAAILVGGRARRFNGRDKSAIIVDGRSILDRQLGALSSLTDDILLVAGTAGHERAGVRVVVDRAPGAGPLAGVEAALMAARDEHVLVLACDMPFVTTAFLGYLLSLAPEADAVVPRTDRGYHPLCAVYSRACSAAATRSLAEGRLALKDLLSEVRVRTVERDAIARHGDVERLLANVNTPADFDELETVQGHKL